MNYTDYSFRMMRDRDFMLSVRRMAHHATSCPVTVPDVVRAVLRQPAPSYYVGMPYAWRRLRHYRRTGHIPYRGRGAGRRWVEIFSRVDALRQRHGITDAEALSRVLAHGCASSFFIEPSSGVRLYHRLRYNSRKSKTEL